MPLTVEERRTRLHACAGTITTKAMDLWWEHNQKGTTACVSQLEKSLPRLAKLNRSYQGLPLLTWLTEILCAGGDDAKYAASALAKMGEKAAVFMPQVLAALVEMLRAGGDDAWRAADALGEIGEKAAISEVSMPEVLDALMHPIHISTLSAGSAASALGKMVAKTAIPESLMPEVLDALQEREWERGFLEGHYIAQAKRIASIQGIMGEKAVTVEVVVEQMEMLRSGGDGARSAAKALGRWHECNLRVFASDKSWKALSLWRLAEGERSVPTPRPSGWQETRPVPMGMRAWTCDCKPPVLFDLPVHVLLDDDCPGGGMKYRLAE